MARRTSFFKTKKVKSTGKYLAFLVVAAFIGTIFYAVVSQMGARKNFKSEAKSFNICAVVKHKIRREGDHYNGGLNNSRPEIIFMVKGQHCKYRPAVKEWGLLNEGQYFRVEGKAIPTYCRVKKVFGACDVNSQKEFRKFD